MGVRSACEDLIIPRMALLLKRPQENMNRGTGSEEVLAEDRMQEIIQEKVMVGPGGMRCY